MIDFTNCKRVLSKAYSGANGKKIAVEYEGEQYMLKFPPSGKERKTELSYINSCYSEHLGSSIFNMLGINAQKTMLGTFTVGNKEKVVCACADFTATGKTLYDFCAIKNTVIDSEHGGTGTELSDILDTIEKQTFVDPQMLLEHFWDMFIVDAFLGNFDRHNGNWGFLIDSTTNKAEIAPIYDCGSCLLPQADEGVMQEVLSDEDKLNARIYRFPTSIIKNNDVKISYHDFLCSASNEDCNEAIKRIVPRIQMDEIDAFIDSVEPLTELQKSFYKCYLAGRYEKLLLPAYAQVMDESEEETLTIKPL